MTLETTKRRKDTSHKRGKLTESSMTSITTIMGMGILTATIGTIEMEINPIKLIIQKMELQQTRNSKRQMPMPKVTPLRKANQQPNKLLPDLFRKL